MSYFVGAAHFCPLLERGGRGKGCLADHVFTEKGKRGVLAVSLTLLTPPSLKTLDATTSDMSLHPGAYYSGMAPPAAPVQLMGYDTQGANGGGLPRPTPLGSYPSHLGANNHHVQPQHVAVATTPQHQVHHSQQVSIRSEKVYLG